MSVEVTATIAGLDALAARIEEAAREVCARAAHIFQAEAMQTAPRGIGGNSTNATGDLARSMEVDGPSGAEGVYAARMGPTVVTRNAGPGGTVLNYGRIREFGGVITPKVSKALAFDRFGEHVVTSRVEQQGKHYLLRAREEAAPAVDAMVIETVAAAVEGK